jgi:hypothetical protein
MLRSAGGLALGGLWGLALAGAGVSTPEVQTAQTTEMKLVARLIADKDLQTKAVGSDLKRQYVIVEVTITPRGGYPVTIARDDFLLRSERDNERGTPDSPDRVTGEGVLVVGAKGNGRTPIRSENNQPVFVGGLPGTGSMPQRVGGPGGGTFGGGGGEGGDTTVAASRTTGTAALLETLKTKELRFGETGKPITGYLYFPVDPNQKIKNFHLHYKGAGGTCELRFK